MQVTFCEPLSVNSAVVTKYKGKDLVPMSLLSTWQQQASRVC